MSITRRDAVKDLAALGAVALATPAFAAEGDAKNAIQRENERPGTRDWMLTKSSIDSKTKYRSPWIEGYCSQTSVKPGETIAFHVSTNPTSKFTLDIYRTGYYGGDGGRLVKQL